MADVIFLITNGILTRPYFDPFCVAEDAATFAKDSGIAIVPVFINVDHQEFDYVAEPSSSGYVANVADFAGLSALIDGLVPAIVRRVSAPTYMLTATPLQ